MGTAVVLALSLAVAAGAGGEERRLPACPDRSLCLWKSPAPSAENKRLSVKATGITNLPDRFNNKVSTAYNNRGRSATLYAGRNGNGDSLCIGPNDGVTGLASEGFDDKTSSVRLHRNSTTC